MTSAPMKRKPATKSLFRKNGAGASAHAPRTSPSVKTVAKTTTRAAETKSRRVRKGDFTNGIVASGMKGLVLAVFT